MKIQQGFVLLTLLGFLTSTSGLIGRPINTQYEKPRTYCGRVLATALALLCYEDDVSETKRSGNGNTIMYHNLIPGPYNEGDQLQQAEYGWPWMSALKARSLSSGARNKRQLIVSECCDKACTVQELMTYC